MARNRLARAQRALLHARDTWKTFDVCKSSLRGHRLWGKVVRRAERRVNRAVEAAELRSWQNQREESLQQELHDKFSEHNNEISFEESENLCDYLYGDYDNVENDRGRDDLEQVPDNEYPYHDPYDDVEESFDFHEYVRLERVKAKLVRAALFGDVAIALEEISDLNVMFRVNLFLPAWAMETPEVRHGDER